jgi:hypothetical protein
MDAITAVTLCGAAYCSNIKKTLGSSLPSWTLVWTADQEIGGNTAYIAYDGSSQYAIAIRGSLLSFTWQAFDNWFKEDLNVYYQVAWTYGNAPGAMIAQGASDGLANLMNLVDSSSGASVSMLEFIQANALRAGTSIVVTGHSLGGNLATVVAPWLNFTLQKTGKSIPPISVYTFAAPAAGNQIFATAYDALFQGNSWRYAIDGDIVPTFPVFSSMLLMAGWYSPAPSASKISVTYKGLTATLEEALIGIAGTIEISELSYGSQYTQTNQNQDTVGLSTNQCNTYPNNTIEDWFGAVGCHHAVKNYALALNATPVTCAG